MHEIEEITLFGRPGVKVYKNRPSTINDVFAAALLKRPNIIAIQSEKTALTYAELNLQSNQLANLLYIDFDIRKGQRVAAILANDVEFIITMLACSRLGAVMVPLNTRLTKPEITYQLKDSMPRVIICDDVQVEKVDRQIVPNLIVVGDETTDDSIPFSAIQSQSDTLVYFTTIIAEEDPLFLMYTSGTTGLPKGALVAHVNTIHVIMGLDGRFRKVSFMSSIVAVPMFHITGLVSQVLSTIYNAGTIYSMRQYQNDAYLDLILNHKVTNLTNIPTIYSMLATTQRFKESNFDCVITVGYGGAPTYRNTYDLLKTAFPTSNLHNSYGATETTSAATILPMSYEDAQAITVGIPFDTIDLKIVDGRGEEVATGEIGEVYLRGPTIIPAYWNNDEANEYGFKDGYWCSGDIGTVDQEGYVAILDRKKDMIIRGGENVYSIEVEDTLRKYPNVHAAAVIGQPDELFGESVKAFIVMAPGTTATEEELTAFCTESLAKFKIPTNYEFLDRMPMSASGKILKHTFKVSQK
ncbi:class I adenylate-forming enzyme family protein [Kurthia sibirica]|uniref:Long-chain fatty acid--CoA ligase n=1 Tax=Kurthia sibirica TaxID=202750 RepID=A0A2U3AI60_9BACL|nr:class I adenylate-forming enzyme family protein [Kurthia sibirica]PWI24246.1 long-chain fatty acid--CoA ligase [Kurthia sibirica]GEK34145.1 AMP-dependent ligase [Kurthia sibirica]